MQIYVKKENLIWVRLMFNFEISLERIWTLTFMFEISGHFYLNYPLKTSSMLFDY